jgi:chromosome segregation ATPase
MNHQKLRGDLERLRGELRAINSVDEEEQRMLRRLERDIEELLARNDDDPKTDRDARQRLNDLLARVEASLKPGDGTDG